MKDKGYRLYTDGASRGNPGDGGLGVVLYDENGDIVATKKQYLGRCTNNEAEYRALIAGLEEVCRQGGGVLSIFLDSELLVRQVTGEYRVKSPLLKPLMERIRSLLGELDGYTISHVRREYNKVADGLANEAIDDALRGR